MEKVNKKINPLVDDMEKTPALDSYGQEAEKEPSVVDIELDNLTRTITNAIDKLTALNSKLLPVLTNKEINVTSREDVSLPKLPKKIREINNLAQDLLDILTDIESNLIL